MNAICRNPEDEHQLTAIGIFMKQIQYNGTNYAEIKNFAGDAVLAPYFCMGFNMLSLNTKEGFVTVNEGDWILQDANGEFSVSYSKKE